MAKKKSLKRKSEEQAVKSVISKKGKKLGPYKFDDIKKQQFLESYKITHAVYRSAAVIGINPDTIYQGFKSDPEFKKAKEHIDNRVLDSVENALYKKAQEGNITACIFILCNKRPEQWRNLQETKHSFGKEVDESLDKLAKIIQGENKS